MAQQVAKLNHLRIAPRKVRLVAGIIRGMSVNEAEAQLIYQRQRASKVLLKLLRSAVANAKNNKLDPDKMVIGILTVDQGPMLKRMMMRARGGASGIQKKTSHVTLILTDSDKVKEKRFTIVTHKKAKKLPKNIKPKKEAKEEKEPQKETKEKKETKAETKKAPAKKQDSGVFKKVFRRKSI